MDDVLSWWIPKDNEETEKYDFTDLTLVYEVDLKVVDHSIISKTEYSANFSSTDVYKTYGKIQAYQFKHVLLDLASELQHAIR